MVPACARSRRAAAIAVSDPGVAAGAAALLVLGSWGGAAAGTAGQACVAQCHCPQRLQGPGGGPDMSQTCVPAAIQSP